LSKEELENFVTFPELVQKRNQLKEVYDKSKKLSNMSSIKNHMAYLVLCLNTMAPPLRLDFLDMELWKKKTEPPADTTNYLWIKSKDDMVIVINQDKVSHHEKAKGVRGIYPLKDEIINKTYNTQITDGAGLMEILNDSLTALKRNHVLIKLKDYSIKGTEHLPDSTYNQSILQWLFKPRKPSQNVLRKAYINHFYNLQKTNINDHKAVANRMRHSYSTASENYVKINIEQEDLPDIVGTEVKLLPERLGMHDLQIRKKSLFDPSAYSKKYRAGHKVSIDNARKVNYSKNKDKILAAKIIWHLNNNLSRKPRQASIDRYGLIQSAETGMWSIKI
jgi:hypothetical protein